MLISLTKRFVFISNTKTASTSLESALDTYAEIRARFTSADKHATWQQVQQKYYFLFKERGYRPETFFRFGIIRDPVDWFVSWYNFRTGSKVDAPLPPDTTIEAFWRMDDWVKFDKGNVKHLQKNNFCDADGVCRFDLVLPMDMLPTHADLLFRRLGVYAQLPVENASTQRVTRNDLPAALIEEIREFWAEDYAFIAEMRERAEKLLRYPVKVEREVLPETLALRFNCTTKPVVPAASLPFTLDGVLVTHQSVPDKARLRLRIGDGKPLPLDWHLKSPRIARLLRGNPRAATARFVAKDVVLETGQTATLELVIPGGEAHRLATFSAVDERATHTSAVEQPGA